MAGGLGIFHAVVGRGSGYAGRMNRIVMADDHAVVRAGLRAMIEQTGRYRIVAECADVDEARHALCQHAPDVMVLDISLPGGGLNLLAELQLPRSSLAVLILSMHTGEPYVSEALRHGAMGYISKGTAADELLTALECVAAGHRYLGSDLCAVLPAPAGIAQLSERERTVFLMLAQGRTPKQVALDLGISVKTAYLHRSSIREKLDARTDLQLHRIAVSYGLLC